MTAIVTRTPLDPLRMTGGQANGNKRKSTRLAFDGDDDAPPTKRTKGEIASKSASVQATNTGKSTPARTTSNVKTRARKAYDEVADDFTFTRARTRKAKVEQPVQPPEPRPEPPQVHQLPQEHVATENAAPAEQPKRKRPRKTLPVSPDHLKVQKEAPRRRSQRLSSDNNQAPSLPAQTATSQPEQASRDKARPAPEERVTTPKQPTDAPPEPEQSPVLDKAKDGDVLQVDKKRRLTIPLPFADTPIIRRNKEMRKHSAEQSRRSSSGMRGRRASSLIDTGASHAVPHTEVETQELYKHISQDLIEPKRMRQLLMWCGNRALPEKPNGQLEPDETAAIHAARVIQEELLKEFSTKSELSSWFDREDIAPAVLVKKPNPRNIQNAEKLQQLELELARLQEEKRSWDQLLASTSGNSDKKAERYPTSSVILDTSSINASLLDPSQSDILNILLSNTSLDAAPKAEPNMQPQQQPAVPQADVADSARQRISHMAQSIEFKIDQFADSTHRMEQYRQTAERVADRILASGAQRLEERDQKVKAESNGGASSGGDSLDTLRSLARVLHGKGKGRGKG